MASSPSLSLSIPGVSVTNESVVLYLVALELGGETWSVRRRFAEFAALHAAVRRGVPPEAMPELPPKSMRL